MLPLEFKFKYQRRKSIKERRLRWCKRKICFAFHWLIVIFVTTASFFTGIAQTDVSIWNMSLYCESEKFNQPLTPVDRSGPMYTMIAVSVIIVIVLFFKTMYCGSSQDILNIVHYFLGFLLCWDICFVLQTIISYPIPSFLQNKDLNHLYCCQNCSQTSNKKISLLDKESRGSFPSFLICGSTYVSAFLFLFSHYFDDGQRFAVKLVALFVPGGTTFIYSWFLWQYNEHHIEDLIGGAAIGLFLAFYIGKDIFYKNSYIENFTERFVNTLLEREIQLTQMISEEHSNREGTESNQYTINLYPQETETSSYANPNDLPPPYSSLI